MMIFRRSAELRAPSKGWRNVSAALACALLGSSALLLADALPYRTDGGDEKLPWFQLKPGEFPPDGSAHYMTGELIGVDHINRTGVYRVERTDSIRRGEWDQSMPFAMLPYGSLSYHGAPAELRDIPIGTHFHGLFYWDEKAGKDKKGAFTKALRLEDDFSFLARQQRAWRVESVQLDKGVLNVLPEEAGQPVAGAKPTAFQVNAATQVWKGRGIGALSDIAPGQSVLLNLTVCTLKGPGRCTDVWLDPESREVAAAHQREVHRQFEREHGLPAWIDEVDNQQGTVTATLFGGFDPKLLEDFSVKSSITATVAEESLRTYDQINDRISGELLDLQNTPPAPGGSDVRLKFKPGNLLEGFRPKRFVRLFSGKWKVDDLPKEERLYQ